MDAKELRIGNWIRKIDGRGNYQVDAEIICSLANSTVEEMEEEFIPLDEEWLIKLGFNHGGGYFWIDIEDVYIAWEDEKKCCFLYQGDGDGMTYGKAINHVHSLQNLYYALTSEELTIK